MRSLAIHRSARYNTEVDVDNSDHRTHDFPGWEGPEWEFKGQHVRKYRQLGAGKTRVISVYTGLFLEVLISPFRASPLSVSGQPDY